MSSQPINPIEVFYSYAHEDEKLRDDLKKHLANLKRQGIITDWYDRDISAGEEWDDEIKKHLDSASVILLLISPDFMSSDYISTVEVKRAMERHDARDARVIPIVLRPVDWKGAPFSKLQSLPSDIRPITLWENQDEAFLDVTMGIRKAITELSGPSATIPTLPVIPRTPKVGFISRRDKDGNDIVQRLRSELAPEKNQLVALWGPGGVGKTTLAAEAVRSLTQTTAQRLVWITADARPNFTFSTFLDDIAEQLGRTDLRPLAFEQKEKALLPLIAAAPTLIALDNLETISPNEEMLCKNFLAKRAPCSALITTRERIEDALLIPLAAMTPGEAAEFLKRLIGQSPEPDIYVVVEYDNILRTAEYNPLIIQWIVAQIDLAQDPEEVLRDLAQGQGDAAERVFDRSFQLRQLDNGGRAVLLALSLFVPSAGRKALADVAGLNRDRDRRRFRDAVKTLSSLWLLRAVSEGERLAVEGLTRQLTEAHLTRDPRSKPFRERYVARFVRYAEVHAHPSPEHYDALEQEKDNLLAAMDVAFALNDWEGVVEIRNNIEEFLDIHGYWDEAILRGEQAIKAANNANDGREVARLAVNTAVIRINRGEYDKAKQPLEQAIAAFRELADDEGIGTCLHNLAAIEQHEGKTGEALRLYTESLEMAKKVGNNSGFARTLHQMAILAGDQGQPEEARRLYDQSLEIYESLDDDAGKASSLHQLGLLLQKEGELEEARHLFNESLELSKKLGSPKGVALTSAQLGRLTEDEGNYPEASRLFGEAFAIFEKLKSPEAAKARRGLERVKDKFG